MRKMLGLCVGGLLLWTALCQAQTGSVQVTLAPARAISAGAQWNVDGGEWQSSGATIGGLTLGTHTINYNTITNWNSPAAASPTITYNTTTPVTALTYNRPAA